MSEKTEAQMNLFLSRRVLHGPWKTLKDITIGKDIKLLPFEADSLLVHYKAQDKRIAELEEQNAGLEAADLLYFDNLSLLGCKE